MPKKQKTKKKTKKNQCQFGNFKKPKKNKKKTKKNQCQFGNFKKPKKTKKKTKKNQCQFTDFGVATGFFWFFWVSTPPPLNYRNLKQKFKKIAPLRGV